MLCFHNYQEKPYEGTAKSNLKNDFSLCLFYKDNGSE